MRRATAVETDLFQIQVEILSDRRYEYETGDDTAQKPQSVVYRVTSGQSRNGLSHVDQSGSIDHQCDRREASGDDPGGISLNASYVLPISTVECLNGSDAMRLRYGDRSCRRCLRYKRSDTDKSLLSQVGFWGASIPQRLVCGASALGCSGQCRNGRATVCTVSLIFLKKLHSVDFRCA